MESTGSLILLAFIGVFIFTVHRSKKRKATALYILLWTVTSAFLYIAAGYFSQLTAYAVGYIAPDIGMLGGMLAGLIHSRRSLKVHQPQAE